MKSYGYGVAVLVAGMSLAGCMAPQGQPDYTASGALAGGATGAIIGSMAEHSGSGALVGGAVGAVVGGIIGHGMDQDQEAWLREQAPQTVHRVEQCQPLTTADVKALVQAGVSDELVIRQLRSSRAVYHLQTADIIDLKNAGVSETIIDLMIAPLQESRSAGSAEVAEVVVPAPPDPGYIWIEGTWLWMANRWIWHPGYWHPGPGHHPMHRHHMPGPRW